MKTVRVVEYLLFGKKDDGCTSLMYRGKVIKDFTGPSGYAEFQARRQQALRWAKRQGFTHYQLGEDTLKRNTLIGKDADT